MWKTRILIFFLNFVLIVNIVYPYKIEEIKKGSRNKRHHEDDYWDWGYYQEDDCTHHPAPPNRPPSDRLSPNGNMYQPQTVPQPMQQLIVTNQSVITTTEDVNPCGTYHPEKPNFLIPGRRISVAKCYEYIWLMEYRQGAEDNAAKCIEYRRRHGENLPYFAIGGVKANAGDYPHMVAIGWKAAVGTWIFKCGGSLISSKWVLTAAHCSRVSRIDTSVADPKPQIVRLGDVNIIDKYDWGVIPKDIKITKFITHPNYKSPAKYWDIALLELESDVQFTKFIQPACLWQDFDTTPLGTRATLTGWGVVETVNRTTTPDLQAAVVDIIDSESCDRYLRRSCNRHWCGVQDHQLCAGKLAGGVDACQGDSGGPLQVQLNLPVKNQGTISYIIGVIAFGVGCAEPDLPGIYTRVSYFIDWIESIVWP